MFPTQIRTFVPVRRAHVMKTRNCITAAILAVSVLVQSAISQTYSSSGRWSTASPSRPIGSAAESDRTPIHMAWMRGWDDWDTALGMSAGHHHSYLFWWENRDNLCITAPLQHFHGALYGWDPPATPFSCGGSMMDAGFTALSLSDTELDPVRAEESGHDIFCGANSMLSSGVLGVVGGAGAENSGSIMSATFDPHHATGSSMWTYRGRMSTPRWYPTLVEQSGTNKQLIYSGLQYAQLHVIGGMNTLSGTLAEHPRAYIEHARLIESGGWNSESQPAPDPSPPSGVPGEPTPRNWAVAPVTYDDNGDPERAFLYGGKDTTAVVFSEKVYLLDMQHADGLETQQWTATTLDASGAQPAGRFGCSAVVDFAPVSVNGVVKESRDVLWVFGGATQDGMTPVVLKGFLDPPNSNNWLWQQFTTLSNPSSPGVLPGGRLHAAYAYDAKRHRMIVYGGYTDASGTTVTSDANAWALNLGLTPTWKKLVTTQTGASRPLPLAEASLAYGPDDTEHLNGDRADMYLYGGTSAGSSSSYKSDVWLAYLGVTGDTLSWFKLPIASGTTDPAARIGAIVARDRNSWNLRVYGGKTASGLTDAYGYHISIYRDRINAGCDSMPRAWNRELASGSGARYGAVGISDSYELTAKSVEIHGPNTTDTLWTPLAGADRMDLFYPHLFPLPNGHIFNAFAYVWGRPTDELVPPDATHSNWRWQNFTAPLATTDPLFDLGGGSSVMLTHADGSMDFMKCGSRDIELPTFGSPLGLSARLHVDAAGHPVGGWTSAGSMVPRLFHNLVTLPDGRVLVTGGADRNDQGLRNLGHAITQPQLWDPTASAATAWSAANTLADEGVLRGYHSGCLLMPTGQAVSGGGNDDSTAAYKRKFKVFCPPQAFSGNTPRAQARFNGAPNNIQFNAPSGTQTFRLGLDGSNASLTSRVVLIRPGAATHGLNTSQVSAELNFAPCDVGLVVTAPVQNSIPEGDYLLFAQIGGYWTLGTWTHVSNSATSYAAGGEPAACYMGGAGGGDDPGVILRGSFAVQSTSGTVRILDNTLFSGVADGEHAADALRLPSGPVATPEGPVIRLRHHGQGRHDYDGVRLVAVDHAPGQLAHRGDAGVVVGTHAPATACVDDRGEDDLAAMQSGDGIALKSGDVVDVRLTDAMGADSLLWIESSGHPADDGGIVIEQELSSGWHELGVVTPRAKRDAEVLGALLSSHLRLTALGRHRLFGLGRFTAGPAPTRTVLTPLSAERAGHGAADASQPFTLVDGDTMFVHFAALEPPADAARDWFPEVSGTPRGYQPTVATLHARHAPAIEPEERPFVFRLIGGVPNPFAMGTHVLFELPRAGTVRLDVYDAQGRRIRTLGGRFEAGRNSVQWNRRTDAGTLAPRGVYFMRLSSATDEANGRLVVL